MQIYANICCWRFKIYSFDQFWLELYHSNYRRKIHDQRLRCTLDTVQHFTAESFAATFNVLVFFIFEIHFNFVSNEQKNDKFNWKFQIFKDFLFEIVTSFHWINKFMWFTSLKVNLRNFKGAEFDDDISTKFVVCPLDIIINLMLRYLLVRVHIAVYIWSKYFVHWNCCIARLFFTFKAKISNKNNNSKSTAMLFIHLPV